MLIARADTVRWTMPAWVGALILFLLATGLSLGLLGVASQYASGVDFSEAGKVTAVTNAMLWREACKRSLDVKLERGESIRFCEVTGRKTAIGSDTLTVGDNVQVEMRKTKYFVVVKHVSRR